MPIYVYRCDCGHRFEQLVPRDATPPDCAECGGPTRKVPAVSALGGRAGTGPAAGSTPIPWRGVRAGGQEKLQREVAWRQRLEGTGTKESGPKESGPAT